MWHIKSRVSESIRSINNDNRRLRLIQITNQTQENKHGIAIKLRSKYQNNKK